MTNEEKQLLLKDLCARLPYHDLWVQYNNKDWLAIGYGHGRIELLPSIYSSISGPCPLIDEIKPYLRPMSSITEEEKSIMDSLWKENNKLVFADPDSIRRYRFYDISVVDFLNKRHLDYRGLIRMGLALEAPEDMYK